jgi:hypothetical protein
MHARADHFRRALSLAITGMCVAGCAPMNCPPKELEGDAAVQGVDATANELMALVTAPMDLAVTWTGTEEAGADDYPPLPFLGADTLHLQLTMSERLARGYGFGSDGCTPADAHADATFRIDSDSGLLAVDMEGAVRVMYTYVEEASAFMSVEFTFDAQGTITVARGTLSRQRGGELTLFTERE